MKLIEELKQFKKDYETGTIEIEEGFEFSQRETLKTIEFYSNSRYLGKQKDKLGRDKPFYNIVNTAVDTAIVATDIDTKDIVVEAERPQDFDKAFLFNKEIREWMKEINFSKILNEIGETRARYGGVLVKKTEHDGEMKIECVEWKNTYTDPADILNSIIIEKHFLTPYELKQKEGIWENIDEALTLYSSKGYTKTDTRIEIWEVHGQLPEEYLSEEAECYENSDFKGQVHYFAVKQGKAVHLYWKEEKELPYKYLSWKKVSGRSLGRGVVEEGFEAQVWTNDAIQSERNAIELSGKVFLKTNSPTVGSNAITELDNGSIIELEDGKDLDVLNLLNGALPQFQNLVNKWWSQYERTTSSYDAVRGETPPSGQPFRLQALVQQQGASQFDYRREEMGIFLNELFTDWVFPYISKRMNREHILASDFTPEELKMLDDTYATYNANKKATQEMLSGKLITTEDYERIQNEFRELIGKTKQRRFLDIPKDYFKDIELKLSINVTGEQRNKQVVLESLGTILQTVIGSRQPDGTFAVLKDPTLSLIFNRILELSGSGISPVSFNRGEPTEPQEIQQIPQQTPQQIPQQVSQVTQ